jgi:hypothetical protein
MPFWPRWHPNVCPVSFQPHPSLSVLRFAHPALTIWSMNAGELELAPIEDWRGEEAIVVRPRMIVNIHRLPPAEPLFSPPYWRDVR